MDLTEIGRGGRNWIDLACDMNQWKALVNTVMNYWVPKYVGKFLSGGFSKRTQLHGISYTGS
jgi:hypothetical protein